MPTLKVPCIRKERKRSTATGTNCLPASAPWAEHPEEIFASYYDVQKKVGKNEMKNIPYGAIAMWTLADKLACGLQQLMAGARKFQLNKITRNDLFAGNRETASETGITYITDAKDESAKKILAA